MVNDLGLGTTRLFLAFLLAGSVPAGLVQSGPALSVLTVPAAELPSGCALKQAAPRPPMTSRDSRGGITIYGASASWSPFPTNPWSGTDRKFVAAVHLAIDATPRRPLPDAPPLRARDVAASELKWAQNILEAYHAVYATTSGDEVVVDAVTFSDVKFALAPQSVSAMLNPPRGFTSQVVRGATVARVSATTAGECARAVDRHVRSSK
jgi:hypothetical protein